MKTNSSSSNRYNLRHKLRLFWKALARKYFSLRRSRWHMFGWSKLVVGTILTVVLFFFLNFKLHGQVSRSVNLEHSVNLENSSEQKHFIRGSKVEPSETSIIDYLLDSSSLQSINTWQKPSHEGCSPGLLDSNEAYATQLLNDVPTIQRDVELVQLGSSQQLIHYQRMESFDYDEVKGLVALFRNAYVSGDESAVFDCKVRYRPGGAGSQNWNVFQAGMAKTLSAPGKYQMIRGRVVMIASFWAFGYYHWLIESIMRFGFVLDYLHSNPGVKILAYKLPNPKLRAFYELLDLDTSRFIEYNPEKVYHVQELIVPSAVAEGRANPRATSAIRNLLRVKVSMKYQELSKTRKLCNNDVESDLSVVDYSDRLRIVIQQRGVSNTTHRHMSNGDELVSTICTTYPHAIVERYNSDDSVERMFRLHYDADVLVGPHGAGLSNAVFMKEGAHMLEIYMKDGMFDYDWVNPCHENTANALGISYSRVRAKWGKHETQMVVDIAATMEALDKTVTILPKTKRSEQMGPIQLRRSI